MSIRLNLKKVLVMSFLTILIVLAFTGAKFTYAHTGYTCSTICHGDKTAPSAPIVLSSTHPDNTIYYPNNNPSFTWSSTDNLGLKGYVYSFDQSSTTNPGTLNPQNITSANYTNISDGVWYFHVKAVDNGENWSQTTHYKINIGTATPVPNPVPDPVPAPDLTPTPAPNPEPNPDPDVENPLQEDVSVTLSASVKKIKAGNSAILTGYLKDKNGLGIAEKIIKIKSRGKIVSSLVTNSQGMFYLEYRIIKTTPFKAVYENSNGYRKYSKNIEIHVIKDKKGKKDK